MAELYFNFGYAYRMHGESMKTFFQFVNSLKWSLNFKAAKNVVLYWMPIDLLQNIMQNQYNIII